MNAWVYCSGRKGKTYHRIATCNGLNAVHLAGDPVHRLTTREADQRGLAPCKVCTPAPLLRLAQ